MNDVIKSYLGKNLLDEINNNLKEYKQLNMSAKEIYKQIYDLSDLIIMSMYLIALDNNDSDLAFKIKQASSMVKEKRKLDFIDAYKNNNVDNYLSRFSKFDLISLASTLNLYALSKKDYLKLTKDQKKMYDILASYIK